MSTIAMRRQCWCGDEFTANQWNHVHCSPQCRALWKSVRHTIEPKTCHCGQKYQAKRRDQKHCSRRCRERAGRPARNAQRRQPQRMHRCASMWCSRRFWRKGGRFRVFCSPQCRKRVENWNYNNRKRALRAEIRVHPEKMESKA